MLASNCHSLSQFKYYWLNVFYVLDTESVNKEKTKKEMFGIFVLILLF